MWAGSFKETEELHWEALRSGDWIAGWGQDQEPGHIFVTATMLSFASVNTCIERWAKIVTSSRPVGKGAGLTPFPKLLIFLSLDKRGSSRDGVGVFPSGVFPQGWPANGGLCLVHQHYPHT